MEEQIFQKLANPAPLGLLGFGLTTVLLSLVNVGVFPLDTMILAMGLFYGGVAQIIAGIMEYRNGNTFGTVAFTSYGLFWWSFVALLVLPKFTGFAVPSSSSMAAYFLLWSLFSVGMYLALKANRSLQFVFGSLFLLFLMLATKELMGNSVWFNTITGVEGVICGLSAVYVGIIELNSYFGKKELSL